LGRSIHATRAEAKAALATAQAAAADTEGRLQTELASCRTKLERMTAQHQQDREQVAELATAKEHLETRVATLTQQLATAEATVAKYARMAMGRAGSAQGLRGVRVRG